MGNRTKDTSCKDCCTFDKASMCPMTADERWSRKRKREDHEEPSAEDIDTQRKQLERILEISSEKLAQMDAGDKKRRLLKYNLLEVVLMRQTRRQTWKALEQFRALQALKRPHVQSSQNSDHQYSQNSDHQYSQNLDHQYSLTPTILEPYAPLTPATLEPMDVDDAFYHPQVPSYSLGRLSSSINRPPTPASFQFGGLSATDSSIMGVPQVEPYTLLNNTCTPVNDPCPEPEEDPTKSFINLSSVPVHEIPEFFWEMTYSDLRGDSRGSSAPSSPAPSSSAPTSPVPSSSGTASPTPEAASPPLRIPYVGLDSSQSSELSEVCQRFEENGVSADEFFNKILPRLVDIVPDGVCDNSSPENLNSNQNQGNYNQDLDVWNQISLEGPSSWDTPLPNTEVHLLHTEDVISHLQAVESSPNSVDTSIGAGFEGLHISEPL